MKMMHSRLSRNGKSSNRGMTRSNQYEFHVKQYLAQIPTESGRNGQRERENERKKERERERKLKILWRVSSRVKCSPSTAWALEELTFWAAVAEATYVACNLVPLPLPVLVLLLLVLVPGLVCPSHNLLQIKIAY